MSVPDRSIDSRLLSAAMEEFLDKKRVEEAYKDRDNWAKKAIINVANVGKFSSDRTIEDYVKDIWKLDKVKVTMD